MHKQKQTELGKALAEAIREHGVITFADYMRAALYEPDWGYYTQPGVQRTGWTGDFFTSADVSPLFGGAIARWLRSVWAEFDFPAVFMVMEDGAGRGLLRREVLDWVSENDAPFFQALRYEIRDIHEPQTMQPLQKNTYHCIVSNELPDAFPAHILERREQRFMEVYVAAITEEPFLREVLGPLSDARLEEYIHRYHLDVLPAPEAWRCEVHLQIEEWLAEVAAALKTNGYALTIDYGATAEALYTPDRKRGTLLCYTDHTTHENPLERTGETDITAHVNFTALSDIGKKYGLQHIRLTTQRDFLSELGIIGDMQNVIHTQFPQAETERHTDAGQIAYFRSSSLRSAVKTLLDPSGLGGFQTLIQRKAAE